MRRATIDDLDTILELLADDALSASRGDRNRPEDRPAYERAFAAIDRDPAQLMLVAVSGADGVIGTMQLTLIPGARAVDLGRRARGRAPVLRAARFHAVARRIQVRPAVGVSGQGSGLTSRRGCGGQRTGRTSGGAGDQPSELITSPVPAAARH